MSGKKTLFYDSTASTNYAVITAGPTSNLWEIDVLYICSHETTNVAVSLQQHISTDEVQLLNATNISPGETVSIGPLVLGDGDSFEAKVSAGTVDFIAYGTEVSIT